MKGKRGLNQGKIAWLSDRMCLVTHSLFLLGPRQPTKATYGRRKGGKRSQDMSACACFNACTCVWCKKRYITPFLAWRDSGTHPRCKQQWQHHQQNVAVAHTHTHTHTHTHIHKDTHTQIAAEPLEKNTPNVFRKMLCPRRQNHFFPFCPKQTASYFPLSLHQVKIPSLLNSRPSLNNSALWRKLFPSFMSTGH